MNDDYSNIYVSLLYLFILGSHMCQPIHMFITEYCSMKNQYSNSKFLILLLLFFILIPTH